MINNFLSITAWRTLDLLTERNALIYDEGKAFWVWPREDRVILVFDPSAIDLGKLNDDFAHRLSTRLAGRRVVRTNSRGLYLQVGYDIPAAPVELISAPLDLSKQPSPYHLPIGMTDKGDLWLSLLDGDSFFVVGVRGMGKSAELHAFIQALLHGGETLIHAWDGKDNAEYLRYVGRNNFTLMPMDGLSAGLKAIQSEVTTRMRKLAASGYPNSAEYNKHSADTMMPIALVIDEVAEVEDQTMLLKQVKVNRAAGVHPIFATNDPTKSSVVAKSNLGTRISFSVVSSSDSIMGLGRPGANKLPKIQGRGMIEQGGRLIEFQAFTVDYPKPTDAGMQWLADQVEQETTPAQPEVDPAKVISLHRSGKSITAIVNEIGNVSGGNKFLRLKKQVEAIIASTTVTTTTTTTESAEMPAFALETAQ